MICGGRGNMLGWYVFMERYVWFFLRGWDVRDVWFLSWFCVYLFVFFGV